ncbi:unnamed protein product, partial [Discosporangium mesarthrocarpum]
GEGEGQGGGGSGLANEKWQHQSRCEVLLNRGSTASRDPDSPRTPDPLSGTAQSSESGPTGLTFPSLVPGRGSSLTIPAGCGSGPGRSSSKLGNVVMHSSPVLATSGAGVPEEVMGSSPLGERVACPPSLVVSRHCSPPGEAVVDLAATSTDSSSSSGEDASSQGRGRATGRDGGQGQRRGGGQDDDRTQRGGATSPQLPENVRKGARRGRKWEGLQLRGEVPTPPAGACPQKEVGRVVGGGVVNRIQEEGRGEEGHTESPPLLRGSMFAEPRKKERIDLSGLLFDSGASGSEYEGEDSTDGSGELIDVGQETAVVMAAVVAPGSCSHREEGGQGMASSRLGAAGAAGRVASPGESGMLGQGLEAGEGVGDGKDNQRRGR